MDLTPTYPEWTGAFMLNILPQLLALFSVVIENFLLRNFNVCTEEFIRHPSKLRFTLNWTVKFFSEKIWQFQIFWLVTENFSELKIFLIELNPEDNLIPFYNLICRQEIKYRLHIFDISVQLKSNFYSQKKHFCCLWKTFNIEPLRQFKKKRKIHWPKMVLKL